MDTPKPARRRSRKPKVENYYKNLGIRANATQETIKKQYIEMIRAFPPETHPEEFQRIRRAYETLRDPVKRSEYDLMRKYGDRIEKIMEEAYEFVSAGEMEKAASLLRQALKISPDSVQVHLALARVALSQGDEQMFQQHIQIAGDLVPEQEKVAILALKAQFLLEEERAEEALDILEKAKTLYPEQSDVLRGMFLRVYRALGRDQEAYELVESHIPAIESQQPEDIHIFIMWLNAVIDLEKWNIWSKVETRMRKFLKSVSGQEDKLMVAALLKDEHDAFYEVGRFREAEIFIDFAHYIDPKNPFLREERRATQELARVEKEIWRMQRDQNIFPLISFHVYEWFFKDYLEPEEIEAFWDSIPPALLAELREMDEDFAEGIMYLRKKYPLLYRRFQKRWDTMFNERVGHLNREARRRLKYSAGN